MGINGFRETTKLQVNS